MGTVVVIVTQTMSWLCELSPDTTTVVCAGLAQDRVGGGDTHRSPCDIFCIIMTHQDLL